MTMFTPSMTPRPMPTAKSLSDVLGEYSYRFANEIELQDGIARVLGLAHVTFEREVRLTPKERIDFIVGEGIGVEVKIAGAFADVIRQMQRYAEHPRITALVLATTCMRHDHVPLSLVGKPCTTIYLARST